MRTRTILASLVAFFAGLTLCLAADVNMGTWKLNEGKSKFSPSSTKNHMVVYEAAGENVKVTVEGKDKDGKAVHNVWVGKFDGKDYPVTGDATYDSRSYTKVDDHTLDMTIKKGGKVVGTGKIAVSADGKSRTVTTKSADPKDTALNATAVYDKQ